MPLHDKFTQFLDELSPDELNELGRALESGNPKRLTDNPKISSFLKKNNFSVSCLSNGNSKIFKVTQLGSTDSFILKLEKFSMPEEIAARFNSNPVLKQAIAPVYSNKDCIVGTAKRRIQIQPYCVGGTLESETLKPTTDKARLDRCHEIFQQVTTFYTELEKENILFPDGKPSNFTINETGQLAITDMKMYQEASRANIDNESCLNSPSYPLYIPPSPPRELSKIHSRHIGLNIYAYLSGMDVFNDLMEAKYNNQKGTLDWQAKPISSWNFSKSVFQTEEGKLYRSLIESTYSEDQTKRPDAIEIQRALDAIRLITQLEASLPRNAYQSLIAEAREEFKRNARSGMTFQPLKEKLTEKLKQALLFDSLISNDFNSGYSFLHTHAYHEPDKFISILLAMPKEMQLRALLSQSDQEESLWDVVVSNPDLLAQIPKDLLMQSPQPIMRIILKSMPTIFDALISNDFDNGHSKLYTDACHNPDKFISTLLAMPKEMQIRALRSESNQRESVWDVVVLKPDLLAKIHRSTLDSFFDTLMGNDYNNGYSKLHTDAYYAPDKFISTLLAMSKEMQLKALLSQSNQGQSVWDILASKPYLLAQIPKSTLNSFFDTLMSNDYNNGYSKLYTDAHHTPDKFISTLLAMPKEIQLKALLSQSNQGQSVWDVVVSKPDLLAQIPDALLISFVGKSFRGDSIVSMLQHLPVEKCRTVFAALPHVHTAALTHANTTKNQSLLQKFKEATPSHQALSASYPTTTQQKYKSEISSIREKSEEKQNKTKGVLGVLNYINPFKR